MRQRNTALLTPRQAFFVIDYLRHRNATRAYRAAYGCGQKSAEASGPRLLGNVRVAAAIAAATKEQFARLQMDADEAMAGISNHARADIRKLFRNGRLLPVEQWPDDVADAVKAVKSTRFGPVVVMYDKLRARELIALAGGALKQSHQNEHTFDHAAYLAEEPPAGDE